MKNLKQIGFLVLGIALFNSCTPKEDAALSLKNGIYRGTITLQQQALPFNFELNKIQDQFTVTLHNAEERLLLDEVKAFEDSIHVTLHIFDAIIKARIDGDSLHGVFIKNAVADYKLPFKAKYGQSYRFAETTNKPTTVDFTGKYSVTFIHEQDTTPSIGIFKQLGSNVTGTFLTPTGDYRYLEGNIINETMFLSTFDGNHAYIFTATKQNDGTLKGDFRSGKAWFENWTGVLNENAALPDSESLTYLKEGYDKIEFAFPDVNNKSVSLADAKYKDKVVILQLGGTWCPNCMDETKFLAPWYEANKARGVEIIGLAYEQKPDFNYASSRVKKMTEKLKVGYDYLIAGTNDKAQAATTLPMLNKVVAFPTTIFIGKDGKVKKIHTGFTGPGTGIYYDQFVQHFNETVNELLAEKIASK